MSFRPKRLSPNMIGLRSPAVASIRRLAHFREIPSLHRNSHQLCLASAISLSRSLSTRFSLSPTSSPRAFSTGSPLPNEPTFDTDGEKRVYRILTEKFPGAASVRVKDISGGCGSMYEVHITSAQFEGKRTVARHRMVNEALAEEIKGMHGLRIFTASPGETEG